MLQRNNKDLQLSAADKTQETCTEANDRKFPKCQWDQTPWILNSWTLNFVSLCNVRDAEWESDSDSSIKKALEVIMAYFMVMFQDLPWGTGKECEKSDKWRRVFQDSHKDSIDFRS